jgi:predicted phosphoribosyltransferase
MYFKDRKDAGEKLAHILKKYKDKDVVIYALPRGGVVTAKEISRYLHAPLDLIITRKIGHPESPEYAIAATAENGHIVGEEGEIESVGREWLEKEMEKEKLEAKRRREKYLQGRETINVEGKIAILVDDGIATGLTMRVAIMELKHRNPRKIVVAIPVIPTRTAEILGKEADEVVALDIPPENEFLGAVGAYYNEFSQISDEEVMDILKKK